MEFVDGVPLREYLRERGPLPVEEACRILAQIADAIDSAHREKLIHRDLKPENIILDCKSNPKVADFGLAIHEEVQHAHRGELAGTLAYMAPEQLRGDTHLSDGRTDIWAFGVMLYECLTGTRPFLSKNPIELRDEIFNRSPRPMRQIDESIPKSLDDLCMRCLQKNAENRPHSAKAVANALREYQQSKLPIFRLSIVGACCLATAALVALAVWGGLLRTEVASRAENSFGAEDLSSTEDLQSPENAPGTNSSPNRPIPIEFAFNHGRGVNHWHHDKTTNSVFITTEDDSLISFGDQSEFNPTVQLRVRSKGVVWAGVFWNLISHDNIEDSNRTFSCRAIALRLKHDFLPDVITVYEFKIEEKGDGSREIVNERILHEFPTDKIVGPLLKVQLQLQKGTPESLEVDGAVVDTSQIDGWNYGNQPFGRIGLFVREANITVERFLIQHPKSRLEEQ